MGLMSPDVLLAFVVDRSLYPSQRVGQVDMAMMADYCGLVGVAQIAVFRMQLLLAVQLQKPMVIHCRDLVSSSVPVIRALTLSHMVMMVLESDAPYLIPPNLKGEHTESVP
ncbi:hypothetical protein CAPTEDRAFT_211740 [Capitella teleta]|uniref:Uncharacterized protein n=1 Tax=Capitella teleta TaxID=283909 RepID=R7VHN2_CAPTE|nr:hypothetical protein CAPTEDRAFT_211740 [Capitella teleta]|eukprot:ELU15175.1 hypothetical protein CAPTEDRAFT_211740 [Capitella teleta]